MIIINLVLLIIFLFILAKSADFAIKYSSHLARLFRVSEFLISFLVVSIISCSPEATISVISALEGIPSFGLGTLLGSNVADLTLVFGIVALFSVKGIKIKSEVLKKEYFYFFLLLLPVLLGVDGNYSRLEGIILIVSGIVFFLTISFKKYSYIESDKKIKKGSFFRNIILLTLSLGVLILSAYYTIKFGKLLAMDLHIPNVLIGLTIVSIGTCLPELLFSIKAVRKNHDGLALGDILGTVITDATILVGIIALISPFSFNPIICYTTGLMMFLSGLISITFMNTGKILSKKEGIILLIIYFLFLLISFRFGFLF